MKQIFLTVSEIYHILHLIEMNEWEKYYSESEAYRNRSDRIRDKLNEAYNGDDK